MKFIRDIIGEKRLMAEEANGNDAAAPAGNALDERLERAPVDEFAAQDQFMSEPQGEAEEHVEEHELNVFADEALAEDEAPLVLTNGEAAQVDIPVLSGVKDGIQDALEGDGIDAVADDFSEILAGFSEQEEIDARTSDFEFEERRTTQLRMAQTLAEAEASQATEPATMDEPMLETVADTWSAPEQTTSESADMPVEDYAAPQSNRPEETGQTHTPEPAPTAALDGAEPPEAFVAPKASGDPVEVPHLAIGRGANRQGRVKTRLLGFNAGQAQEDDPIADKEAANIANYTKFPLGWLIVTAGPGRGAAFTLSNGVNKIGRGKDQTISLDFGDNSISRENHAAIAFDAAQKSFFIGHGGKANLVRRNNRPVLSTEEIAAGDIISIGETTLRFVPLCGPDFSWEDAQEDEWSHAANH